MIKRVNKRIEIVQIQGNEDLDAIAKKEQFRQKLLSCPERQKLLLKVQAELSNARWAFEHGRILP